MKSSVDVAVIGAGHAGLNAIKEIRKVTDDWVLINGGPLGTTCARIGCMPSKVAIHLADTFQLRERFGRYGVEGGQQLRLDGSMALEHVREMRDTFVDLVLANSTDEMDSGHLIDGYARFIDERTLGVGDHEIEAGAIVVACGAHSAVPSEWEREFGDGILTVENVFDQETLPDSVAVIGMGPIGVEMGQALHRMGIEVTGIERGETVSRIKDPAINRAAIDILNREFPIWLGHEPKIERRDGGFRVRCDGRQVDVERLFLALGRKPNLEPLGLGRLGVLMNGGGIPVHDVETLQVKGLPIYLAGDANGGIANLQRAAQQGRIAGYNAVHRKKKRYVRRTPMSIVFSEPNIACVGLEWHELNLHRTVVAEQRFGPVGRALIMGQNRGLLRVYADKSSRRLLGAAMVGTRCEHLAHLVCWAIESGMTVERALEMPFYHPVIEEALQDALIDLHSELEAAKPYNRFAFLRPKYAVSTL